MKALKPLLLVVLFLVMLALPVVGRYASFYSGLPSRPDEVPRPKLAEIEIPTPPAAQYSDKTVIAGDGTVVVDMAHENRLEMAELNVLGSLLATRGHRLLAWDGGDLSEALETASALIVPVPLASFTLDELDDVVEFVDSGGRLLLVGDPTRFGYLMDDWGWIEGIDSDATYLNELGSRFGVTFVDDYLYNVSDNEGNFRNIKLEDWGESDLTAEMDMVVFYAAHSLVAAEDSAIIFADDNTWSSSTDRAGGLAVVAQSYGGRVVALGDLTFMTEPYHTVRDNNRLIANLADFLTRATRQYTLYDFPLLFGQETVLIFANSPELGPGKLYLVDDLEELFEAHDRDIALAEEPDSKKDALFLGLYSQSDPVAKFLDEYGVTLSMTLPAEEEEMVDDESVEETVEEGEPPEEETNGVVDEDEQKDGNEEEKEENQVLVQGVGTYEMSGIALILTHQEGERAILTVLAASQDGLIATVDRLGSRDYYDCVMVDELTLCPTGEADEDVELEWTLIGEVPEEPEEEELEDEEPEEIGDWSLSYGDTVTAELEVEERHEWTFAGSAGDAVIIRADPISDGADLVLELETEDGEYLTSVDEGLSGDTEEISNYSLPDSGDYIIRVYEYWDEGGEYSLTLELGTGEEEETEEEAEEIDEGSIAIGDTVEGTLEQDQTAVWSFEGQADEPITIVAAPMEGGEVDGDLALELRDSDGDLLAYADETFAGEEERIEGRLPADGTYEIVVSEYYGEEVTYSLSLQSGGSGDVFGGWGILIVSADDGTPTAGGLTSDYLYLDILAPDYDVTYWSLAQDGEITYEEMQDYQLVIWTSGDFQGGTADPVYSYLFEGGALMVSGAYPALFEDTQETAMLVDLEVSTTESNLTDGFTPGEVIDLTAEIDAVIFDEEEDGESLSVFFRGPASDEAGDMIAIAIDEGGPYGLKALVIGFPPYLLPEWAQTQLVENAVEWFDVSPAQ